MPLETANDREANTLYTPPRSNPFDGTANRRSDIYAPYLHIIQKTHIVFPFVNRSLKCTPLGPITIIKDKCKRNQNPLGRGKRRYHIYIHNIKILHCVWSIEVYFLR